MVRITKCDPETVKSVNAIGKNDADRLSTTGLLQTFNLEYTLISETQ